MPEEQGQPQQQEKREFLKRDEIRTMSKDTASARTEEVQREREKISHMQLQGDSIRPKQQTTSAPPRGIQPGIPTAQPTPSFPPQEKPFENPVVAEQQPPNEQPPAPVQFDSPPPSGGSDNTLVKAIIIGVILLVLINGAAVGYWLWSSKSTPAEETTPPEATEPVTPPTAPTPPPTPPANTPPTTPPVVPATPPEALFLMEGTKTLSLADTSEIPTLLTTTLASTGNTKFTHLVFQNTEKQYVTGAGILQEAGIQIPSQLATLLAEDGTLYLYSTTDGKNRLGFAIELNNAAIATALLRSWETTMETDTAAFFAPIGQKDSAYVPFFRTTTYPAGQEIRFQTFSKQDLGIVYAVRDNTLIMTSSLESMKAALDRI